MRRRRDLTPWILTAALLAVWIVLAQLTEAGFFAPAYYDSYTRQALAWRQGSLHLSQNIPHLELAIYEGDYYVSFPPVPSLVLLPLTFLFGAETPDNLLVKLYALGACLLMYRALRRAGYGKCSGGLIAFLFCMGSSLLPMTLDGSVWYHAQTLAFFLMVASICLLAMDRMTPCLFLYALSVGCRPFNALYAAPLFGVWFFINHRDGVPVRAMVRALLPGIGLGLLVALDLGLYNFIRFGNPLEFGHNYLPEFSFQGGVQFSLDHVKDNAETFLLGLPLEKTEEGWAFRRFGYSMLIACPALTLMLAGFAVDVVKKQLRWEKVLVLACCVLHAFLLLLHRTFGGFQLGARYAVDLMPYAFFYLLLTPEKRKAGAAEILVLAAVFLMTCVGVVQVHI